MKKILPVLGIILLAFVIVGGNLFSVYTQTHTPKFVQYAGTPYNSGYWWYHDMVARDRVDLAGYTITVTGKALYCNGWTNRFGYKIVRNGTVIEDVPVSCDSPHRLVTRNLGIVRANIGRQMSSAYYTVYSVVSDYEIVVPPGAITMDIETPRSSYFRGENATLKIIVNNSLPYTFTADVGARVCQPTFGKQHCETLKKTGSLPPGTTTLEYTVPTGMVVDKLYVQPFVDLWLDVTRLEPYGLNVYTYDIYDEHRRPLSSRGGRYKSRLVGLDTAIQMGYKYIHLGKNTGEEKTVMINPEPLWMDKAPDGSCPDGYHESPNGEYCISDRIEGLSCLQLGCPVVPGHEYVCTSSGICAETVYVYIDCRTRGCPEINGTSGTCDTATGNCVYIFQGEERIVPITCKEDPSICPGGTTCDTVTGACIKTEVYHEVVQCQEDSDCPVPCDGMTATCTNGYCSYEGSCTPTVVVVDNRTVVYERLGCADLGGDRACPDGYYCDKERNVCTRSLLPRELIFLMGLLVVFLFGFVAYVLARKGWSR